MYIVMMIKIDYNRICVSNRYIARRDVVMIFRLRLKNIFFIFVGAAIFSFGIVHFNMQNNLSEGGFTGITLLFYFLDRKSTRLNSSHVSISYAVFCLKKK